MKAIRVPVIESEKDWGIKVDDYMVCLSKEDAKAFVKEFNSKNDSPTVPDWYMYAEDNLEEIELSDKQFSIVKESNRFWLSSLIKI